MNTITEKHTRNTVAWIENMRTTLSLQGQGRLCVILNGQRRYCCLGLGSEQAGVESAEMTHTNGLEIGYGSTKQFGLAPVEFIDWLGVPYISEREDGMGYDLVPDFPEGLTEQVPECGDRACTDCTERAPLKMTAASMNDTGFSFHQIADVFDYFGIRGAA